MMTCAAAELTFRGLGPPPVPSTMSRVRASCAWLICGNQEFAVSAITPARNFRRMQSGDPKWDLRNCRMCPQSIKPRGHLVRNRCECLIAVSRDVAKTNGTWRREPWGFRPYSQSGFPHDHDQWICQAAPPWRQSPSRLRPSRALRSALWPQVTTIAGEVCRTPAMRASQFEPAAPFARP
jgi:hypothetical protein